MMMIRQPCSLVLHVVSAYINKRKSLVRDLGYNS